MLKRTFFKLRYSAFVAAGVFLFTAAPSSAASLTYKMISESGGGLPQGFAMSAIFDDNVIGNEDAIRGRVSIQPGSYVGDIVAFYIDLLGPLPTSLNAIAAAVTGDDITNRGVNTKNIQSGSVGSEYSIGLAIGLPGIGNGKGDIHSTEFFLNTPGLTLANLGGIAVRMTSVGTEFDGRNLSGKVFGFPGKITETPEPGTWALLLSGGALVLLGRKRFQRN